MNKITDYIEKWKTFREDEDRFKMFIKSLDHESLINFIIQINKDLRFIEDDKEVISEGVIAGDIVAVTKTVRENITKQLIEYIKKEEDIKSIATLMYYLIINYHMFSDGNGRTARFIYDMISDNLDETEFMYYFHKENDTYYPGKENFEEKRNILDLTEVNWISNSFIKEDINEYLEKYPELKNKRIECGFGGYYADRQKRLIEFLKTNLKLELTEKEYAELAQLITDNGGVRYTPSGIGMMIVSAEKGDIKEWINANEKLIAEFDKQSSIYSIVSTRMNFSLSKNKNLLANWSTDDFRRVKEISNNIKQRQLEHLIGIFNNPTAYSYNEEINLKEYFLDQNCVNKDVNKSL